MSFDQFWAIYPRRVAKLDAMKAYDKALKIASADEILAGARRYAATVRDPQFTKHPATWLRGGCWMDEEAAPMLTGVAAERDRLRKEIENDQQRNQSKAIEDSRHAGGLFELTWERPQRPH